MSAIVATRAAARRLRRRTGRVCVAAGLFVVAGEGTADATPSGPPPQARAHLDWDPSAKDRGCASQARTAGDIESILGRPATSNDVAKATLRVFKNAGVEIKQQHTDNRSTFELYEYERNVTMVGLWGRF